MIIFTAYRYKIIKILILLSIVFTSLGMTHSTEIQEKITRFLSFKDFSVKIALIGCVLLGINCGLWGVMIVSRRLSLVGDTLSHVALPGLAIGFLITGHKQSYGLFIGALCSAGIGMLLIACIQKTTRIRNDSTLAMILSGFYAVGICIITCIQKVNIIGKANLERFLFGQISALSVVDIQLLVCVTITSILFISIFFKEILITGFDSSFAKVLGIRLYVLNYIILFFVAVSVIVALQAVGVILVTALLIIPAATAYLLVDGLTHMFLISITCSILASFSGVFFSFLGNRLPTGPFVVVFSSLFFLLALIFSPKHGCFFKYIRIYQQRKKIIKENILKSIYLILEKNDFKEDFISAGRISLIDKQFKTRYMHALIKDGMLTLDHRFKVNIFLFTNEGFEVAKKIVRKHRLWELYLTKYANYANDHVHEDAEVAEHLLTSDLLKELDVLLNFPCQDPHGKPIPKSKYDI